LAFFIDLFVFRIGLLPIWVPAIGVSIAIWVSIVVVGIAIAIAIIVLATAREVKFELVLAFVEV
jgi:hypothetical protein